ncbi:MAG TPA: cyanophycin synthetase, partial [Terrimicrobiaceae bacterium]
GEKMPAEAVAAGLTVLRELSEEWTHSPTFFELATALGFWHFAKSGCEFVVLETGMGGRLDATNVIRPLVSVITPIAFDHTRWLGDTLRAIASEKAGIIKPGVPVVSARQEPSAAAELLRQANALSAPLLFVEDPVRSYEIGLRGEHQKKNAAVAVAALQAASLPLDDAAISHGLRELHWPGRFQVVNERLVLDGCHNPHAAAQLQHTWKQVFGSEKATVIFGALADKAYPAMLELLQPISKEFFFVPVASQRAADPLSLGAECKGPYQIFPSGREALERAQGKTLVTGSLFLVGEILEALGLET